MKDDYTIYKTPLLEVKINYTSKQLEVFLSDVHTDDEIECCYIDLEYLLRGGSSSFALSMMIGKDNV